MPLKWLYQRLDWRGLVRLGEACHNSSMTQTSMILDPRQQKAVIAYTSPTSPTFANLKQSMISAGYDEDYADTIYDRKPLWLTKSLEMTVESIEKSEDNLSKFLNAPIDISSSNKIKQLSKPEIEVLKIKSDASKFVLKNLAGKKYGGEEEGERVAPQIVVINYGKSKDEPREATVVTSDSE